MKTSDACSFNCCGVNDNHGACCNLDNRDWIMGNDPIEALNFLQRLSIKLDRPVNFHEVFYEYEEGSQVFPERSMWQRPESYPALRVDTSQPRNPCIFYNTHLRGCSVYDIRPKTCQDFNCQYLIETKSQTRI